MEFLRWQFMEGYKPKFGQHSNEIKWAKDPYLWKREDQNEFTANELFAEFLCFYDKFKCDTPKINQLKK